MNGQRHREPGESPYLSYTDLFVGVIFIFLLLMAILVLKVGASESESDKKLGSFLDGLTADLKGKGVAVGRQGNSMRLPSGILFDSNRYELNAEGKRNLSVISQQIESRLEGSVARDGKPAFAGIIIEGYSDGVPKNASGAVKDNFDLSVLRATSVYRQMLQERPYFKTLKSPSGQGFFSTAGYGDTRPLAGTRVNADEPRNRRIEIRFLPLR